jgi:hypothetical protein
MDLAFWEGFSFRAFLAFGRETTYLLTVGCSKCGNLDKRKLYALVDGASYCVDCWVKAGRPWPRLRATVGQVHEAETGARDRMRARGGADRYRVTSGKS